MRSAFPAILLSLSLWLAGCAEDIQSEDPAATNCNPGVAQIAVFDGFLQNLCGCAEAQGTRAVPPATLTCTVPAGTVMIFQFPVTRLPHQIISTGTPSFVPSPLIDHQVERPLPAYAVPLQTAGTYQFQDAFQATLAGQIVVF